MKLNKLLLLSFFMVVNTSPNFVYAMESLGEAQQAPDAEKLKKSLDLFKTGHGSRFGGMGRDPNLLKEVEKNCDFIKHNIENMGISDIIKRNFPIKNSDNQSFLDIIFRIVFKFRSFTGVDNQIEEELSEKERNEYKNVLEIFGEYEKVLKKAVDRILFITNEKSESIDVEIALKGFDHLHCFSLNKEEVRKNFPKSEIPLLVEGIIKKYHDMLISPPIPENEVFEELHKWNSQKKLNSFDDIKKGVSQTEKGKNEGGVFCLFADFDRQKNKDYIERFKKEKDQDSDKIQGSTPTESGYFSGMEDAAQYVFSLPPETEFNSEHWKKIREKAKFWDLPIKYAHFGRTSFGIDPTPHGLKYLLSTKEDKWDLEFALSVYYPELLKEIYCYPSDTPEESINEILISFSADSKNLYKLSDKIKNLAQHYGEIERLHPFRDGNTRTAWIWLNRELHVLGLPYCILDDPLSSAYSSIEELMINIHKGMINYKNIIENSI